jgi:hypothetical protein
VPTVAVLDRDPDIGGDLAPSEFTLARAQAVARVMRFRKGPWSVSPTDFDRLGSLGLLLIEGVLVRKVTVGERTCAELLGPGDVTQPWLQIGPDSSVATEVDWQVARDVSVAVLDHAFTARVARWPEISAAIASRVMLRVHWLAFHLSLCHMRRVEDRLLLVLWHFADRFGRVTPSGVKISLPLTHTLLANVIGAQRPSVSLAAASLARGGRIERQPRSGWLLHGRPPAELRQLTEYSSRRAGTPPTSLGPAPPLD